LQAGALAAAGEKSYLARLNKAFTPSGDTCTLGETALRQFTEDGLELFFAHLRAQGRAASTRNKYVQLVKAMLRWAVKKGYLSRNPVTDSESIKREKHAKRDRRLVPEVGTTKVISSVKAKSGVSWPCRAHTCNGSSSARSKPACVSVSFSRSNGAT
jgi:site-specific recombinase XerD